ncbi:MAG: 30S ribosomal protein S8 [Leptospiraceae bacterium]|nr:30S ribosomal protein S8 [Leptospiraceae bacterium]MCP5511874.1 30S ribosomal protein S8 [Leptospiraceae bacterium]
MSLTDPIADMLTKIRNSGRAKHANCQFHGSRVKKAILDILKDEGFIADYQETVEKNKSNIQVNLKYDDTKKHVIKQIDRVSRPGRRVYLKGEEIKPVKSNLGISIISTSRGIVTNKKAMKLKIGGEVICVVS